MAMRVAANQWVPLRVPTGTQKARIAFNGEDAQPAFIENVRGRRGVETYAKLRCPDLRPGVHKVRVYHADGTEELQIQVV